MLSFFTTLLLAFLTFTAAPPPDASLTRIAFGSCLRESRPAPIFEAINDYDPQVFVFLGDNVYGDTEDPDVLQAKYDQLAAIPGTNELATNARVLAIWDDHDYGDNDAGAEWPHKEKFKQIMLDFFNEPKDSPRRKREGNYDAGILGSDGQRVQFILLDTRWFRSPLKYDPEADSKTAIPNDDPEAQLLGEEQFRWLEEQLRQPADIRIICTSIQLLSNEHRFEKWANFPRDRERMLGLLAEAGDVLVLSGDRHSGEISLSNYDDGKVLVEVTSSALNQGRRDNESTRNEPNPYRAVLNEPFLQSNFGTIDIDWTFRLVVVSLRDVDGNVVAQLPLQMAEQ